MNTDFHHFLITRINIKNWHISRPDKFPDINSTDFLKHRFSIFERTCYPSVLSQTNKNFTWLLLVDIDLPIEFNQRIKEYQNSIEIIPVYIENGSTLIQQVREVIEQKIDKHCKYLITTNLDSDDAVSKNFMQLVQDNFDFQDFEFINFQFGYLYRFDQKDLYLREWLTAPMHTLIEKSSDFKTALQYKHSKINHYNHRQVVTKPVWLMSVHGQNVRTAFDINASWQPIHRLGKDFSVNLDLPVKSRQKSFNESLSFIRRTLKSRKKWDTPDRKFIKILGTLFPDLLIFVRKRKFRSILKL